MENYFSSFGYIGLMTFSFLAATILPVSSEAALTGALALKMHVVPVLLFTTIGNCAGVAFNYWLGWKGEEKLLRRHLKKKIVSHAYAVSQRWGKWSLLLSWLPIIGDPLTFLAGVLKIPFGLFVVVTFTLRFLRYLLIVNIFYMI